MNSRRKFIQTSLAGVTAASVVSKSVSAISYSRIQGANKRLRVILELTSAKHGFRFIAPPSALCTDNAAMIAWAGAERLALGEDYIMETPIRPRWPLDESSASVYGFGRKGAKA